MRTPIILAQMLLALALGAGGMWLILRPRRGVLTGAWFV